MLAKLEALAGHSLTNTAIFERTRSAVAFAGANFRPHAIPHSGGQGFDAAGDWRAAFFARAQYVSTLCRLGDFETARQEIAELRPRCEASEDLELKMEFYRIASSVATGEQRYDLGLSTRGNRWNSRCASAIVWRGARAS